MDRVYYEPSKKQRVSQGWKSSKDFFFKPGDFHTKNVKKGIYVGNYCRYCRKCYKTLKKIWIWLYYTANGLYKYSFHISVDLCSNSTHKFWFNHNNSQKNKKFIFWRYVRRNKPLYIDIKKIKHIWIYIYIQITIPEFQICVLPHPFFNF